MELSNYGPTYANTIMIGLSDKDERQRAIAHYSQRFYVLDAYRCDNKIAECLFINPFFCSLIDEETYQKMKEQINDYLENQDALFPIFVFHTENNELPNHKMIINADAISFKDYFKIYVSAYRRALRVESIRL